MTYAITLIKCEAEGRRDAIDYIIDLKIKKIKLSHEVEIEECYISFGWPDLVLVLKGPNVELIKDGIINLRNNVSGRGDGNLETSTLVCTTPEEMKEAKEKAKNIGNQGN